MVARALSFSSPGGESAHDSVRYPRASSSSRTRSRWSRSGAGAVPRNTVRALRMPRSTTPISRPSSVSRRLKSSDSLLDS